MFYLYSYKGDAIIYWQREIVIDQRRVRQKPASLRRALQCDTCVVVRVSKNGRPKVGLAQGIEKHVTGELFDPKVSDYSGRAGIL